MGRAPCCSKVGLHRGPWTPTEDSLLTHYILTHGEGQWRSLPKNAGLLRCGKSCRLRWMNYLRPDIKRGNIGPDEDDLIVRLHALLGNRWSLIAGRLPGRTDNEIKNYWNTHLSKKLRSQGTDPDTHKKLTDLTPGPPKPKPKRKRAGPSNITNKKHNKDRVMTSLAAAEKPKVVLHQPKPVRVTSLSLKRNGSNVSFESNVTSVSSYSQPYDPVMGMIDEKGDGGAGFMIGGEEDDVALAGLGVRVQGSMEHPRAADQNMLDRLYHEYLQLIKVDGDDALDYDDLDGYEARELDSFAESLLV